MFRLTMRGLPRSQAKPVLRGRYQSSQMGQTVNLLAFAFACSNHARPTLRQVQNIFDYDSDNYEYLKLQDIIFIIKTYESRQHDQV